jgi:hypothetical protein
MMIETEATPLAEITNMALDILFQRLGAVNTTRFLNQFTVGYGNYVEEKEELFGHLTMDELISDIKRHQEQSKASESAD